MHPRNQAPGDPILRVCDLKAGYDDVQVLNEVSLEVFPGEAVAILGPNGHGKTTLLRAISGLHRASAGGVWFAGEEITRRRAHSIAAMGLVQVPQGDLLFSDMSVLENLLVGAYSDAAWRRRGRQLELVWSIFPALRSRQNSLARNLSGGERRMCAVGRALMGNARMLMIDEPSLGLAPIAIERLYEALFKLRSAGVTILLVEEAAERVQRLSERVYLLDAGEIVRYGPTESLLKDSALLETYLG